MIITKIQRNIFRLAICRSYFFLVMIRGMKNLSFLNKSNFSSTKPFKLYLEKKGVMHVSSHKTIDIDHPYYIDRFGIYYGIYLINSGKCALSESEKALVSIQNLFVFPGLIKASYNFKRHVNMLACLHDQFPKVINNYFSPADATRLLENAYINENDELTPTGILESFFRENINTNHLIRESGFEIVRPALSKIPLTAKIEGINRNYDFVVNHLDTNYSIEKDHICPEMVKLTPGEFNGLTAQNLKDNKGFYDLSNSVYNQLELDPLSLQDLISKIKKTGTVAYYQYLDYLYRRCQQAGTYSSLELERCYGFYSDLKTEYSKFMADIVTVNEFNSKSLLFQKAAVQSTLLNNYPSPSGFVIGSSLHTLTSENLAVTKVLFGNDTQQIKEFREMTSARASDYLTKLRDGNLRSDISTERLRKSYWYIVNNHDPSHESHLSTLENLTLKESIDIWDNLLDVGY